MARVDDEVRDTLVSAARVEMPEDITGRISRRLKEEAEVRATTRVTTAKAAFDELARQTSRGTFGENMPSHYDRAGVGLDRQEVLFRESSTSASGQAEKAPVESVAADDYYGLQIPTASTESSRAGR